MYVSAETHPPDRNNPEGMCPSSLDGWECTRTDSHGGPHVAHLGQQIQAVWDDDRTTDPKAGA